MDFAFPWLVHDMEPTSQETQGRNQRHANEQRRHETEKEIALHAAHKEMLRCNGSSRMLKKSASVIGRRVTLTSAYLLVVALLDGLFEHPGDCSPVALHVRTIEVLAYPYSFSRAC